MDLHTQIIAAYTSQSYTECINLIDSAPSTVNGSSHIKTLKASCLINIEGKIAEAFGILDKIIEEEPSNGLAYYSKGLGHLKEGKLEESIHCFNMASNLDTKGAISKVQVVKLKEHVMRMKSEIAEKEKKVKAQRASTGSIDPPRVKRKYVRKSLKVENLPDAAIKSEPQTPKRSLTCKICSRTFAQSFSLSRHILIHTGERPHRCEICSAGFIQKSDLNRHMSIHNEATNFECEDCGKKFKTKKNLSCHQLTHSEARPYKCGECDKDFRYKRLLKYHEGMHLTVKPYQCDHCDKVFSAKPNLKSHLKTHLRRMQKMMTKATKLSPKLTSSAKNQSGISADTSNASLTPSPHSEILPSILTPTPSLDSLRTIKLTSSEYSSTNSSQTKLEPILSDFNSASNEETSGVSEWSLFFQSLLGDLNKMDDKQKRKFKTKTFALIDDILE